MKMIDLNQCKKNGSKVLSGRDIGSMWRKNFLLDSLDKSDESIQINVPEDLYSINISFFLGLFGKSIRTLGAKKFKEKYTFVCDEFLMKNIDKYIDKALRTSNILEG